MSYLRFKLRQLMQRMWFLPAAFSVLAVATILIAYSLAGFLPEELPFTMPENAVQSIREILATSLLTVAVRGSISAWPKCFGTKGAMSIIPPIRAARPIWASPIRRWRDGARFLHGGTCPKALCRA